MKLSIKDVLRSYGLLFALALLVAILARLGLLGMDLSNTISYDYISAADVPILDVICSILTGSTFVAFLAVSGLVLVVSTAGATLYGFLFWKKYNGEVGAEGASAPGTAKDTAITSKGAPSPRPLLAFLCGWATALVALICGLIIVSGILSAVQVHSMSSKLPALPMLIIAIIVFAAFLGTLLAAASMSLCACITRYKAGGSLGKNLILTVLICGAIVAFLTVGTFSAINTSAISLGNVGMWFGADIVINIVIIIVAAIFVRRAQARGLSAE